MCTKSVTCLSYLSASNQLPASTSCLYQISCLPQSLCVPNQLPTSHICLYQISYLHLLAVCIKSVTCLLHMSEPNQLPTSHSNLHEISYLHPLGAWQRPNLRNAHHGLLISLCLCCVLVIQIFYWNHLVFLFLPWLLQWDWGNHMTTMHKYLYPT